MAFSNSFFAKTPKYGELFYFKVSNHTYAPNRGCKERQFSPQYYYRRSFYAKTRLLKSDFPTNLNSRISENGYGLLNKSSLPCFSKNIFFQTFQTSPKRNINPLVWFFVRPVLKIAAVLGGRGFRKWWKDLPSNKRKYFLEALKSNSMKILAAGVLIGISIVIYYENHVQETPITKRRRFIVFTQKQSQDIADLEYKALCETHKLEFLHPDLPLSRRIRKIAQKLVDANHDLPTFFDKKWSVVVLNNKQKNAFALPNGYIFINTGMIDLCVNDDQLAIIMAHEVAHCVLGHASEQLSFTHIVDFGAIVVLAAIWAILPSDSIALLVHFLFENFLKVTFHLPYSRVLEFEADEVGIHLAAKACFDVRQSSAFWSKMAYLSKHFNDSSAVEWLSTHPTYEKRSEHLDSHMDKALELRRSCGCPPLSTVDPRLDILSLNKAIESYRRKTLGIPIVLIAE